MSVKYCLAHCPQQDPPSGLFRRVDPHIKLSYGRPFEEGCPPYVAKQS